MSIRCALLGLLAQRPRHGYELHAAFEAVVGGAQNWDVKPAQVYTTLSRLKDAGLVTEEGLEQGSGPEKLVHAITPAGREELQAWLHTPVEAGHQRDEFFVKLMLSLATGAVDPLTLIYAQRASLYQELHALTAQRAKANPRSELAHILLLDQAVMHLEADLRWLEMVEARLDEVRRQPLPEPEPRPRGRPRKAG
ncbi:MAG: PadR family transcriptional regulator [Anaerolineae bacterium]|nr:PadR family transcriptional regulator [Anaerolineae bacterium]